MYIRMSQSSSEDPKTGKFKWQFGRFRLLAKKMYRVIELFISIGHKISLSFSENKLTCSE